MASQVAALLDELMGPQRNAAPGQACDVSFEDDNICKYALCGFCPHELFTNTKADIGQCRKSHDKRFKEQYETSEKFERLGYESEFETLLHRLQNDMRRKIDKNNERLRLSNGQLSNMQIIAQREKVEEKIKLYNSKIQEHVALAESLRKEGRVAEAEKADEAAERSRQDLTAVQKVSKSLNSDETDPDKPQEMVCDICGCFLIKNDVQCRMDEHLQGKLHMGFAKIKVTLEELDRRREERRKKQMEEREKAREKDRAPRERERERSSKRDRRADERQSSRKASSSSRRKRSRSRSNSRHRHSHKSSLSSSKKSRHRSRSRSRSRDRHSRKDSKDNRDKDKDRDRKRVRSKSKDRSDDRKSRKHDRRVTSISPVRGERDAKKEETALKQNDSGADVNGSSEQPAADIKGSPGGDSPKHPAPDSNDGFEDTAPLVEETAQN